MTLFLVYSVQRVRVCTVTRLDVCVDSILSVQMGSPSGSSKFHIRCCMHTFEGFIDACMTKDSLRFLNLYVFVRTRVHNISNVKVFCFDIKNSLRLLFCDEDELNSFLF